MPTHLLQRLGVEKNPAELNNLGRVLCDVDSMLIAGGCDVDHDIAIDVELVTSLGTRHFGRKATTWPMTKGCTVRIMAMAMPGGKQADASNNCFPHSR